MDLQRTGALNQTHPVVDLHRTGALNRMHPTREPEEGKPAQAAEERLDSGLDSLKEEEFQAVAAELRRLRLESEPPAGELHDWRTRVTEDGDTMLHLAIIHDAKNDIGTMIDLSRRTEFLSAQNHQRQTPLHLAAITNQADVCQRLLLAGCDPTLVDEGGDTPLHVTCRHGDLLCFSVITQNCQPDHLYTAMAACNYQGLNCLHLASIQGFLSLVENMVDLGAEVNAKEQRNGRSALHLAVDRQNLSLVKLLLRKGADPNLLTSGGH
ncbi:NF-kappa-B inhibitor alpha-like, partial [Brachionichthys hirsutus]|uniref:NF-kappa-B inhibitor alpha-like n=1 Tax=Brachionichthys hirsutus TaxID=412623 RepID=UPI0036054156